MDVINIRSDTQTLPTAEMLEAIKHAALGDDMYGEDPTVKELEKLAAEMLGQEAALLVISGTMGNLTALMAHAVPGDEVIIDPESHIYYYEGGGLANVAGLMPMPVSSENGLLDPDEVDAVIRKPRTHYPRARILCLENTHNRSGGRVMSLAHQKKLCEIARAHDLKVHLDGARLFNAAIALGKPAAQLARGADSIMFCLSKGLSCPLGSMVAGSEEFIRKVESARYRLGGGMRQAGVIAAAGIVALETMVDRLADDHRHAKLLAEGINRMPGLRVDMASVETNMVYVDHSASGLSTTAVMTRLKEAGVVVSGRPPRHVRLVTNRHHDATTVSEVLDRMRKAFS